MTFSEPVSHSEPIAKSLDLLKFLWYIVYEWFHKTTFCLSEYLKQISSVHSYATSQSLNQDLFVPSIQTTQYGIRSLCYTGTNLWNSLPTNIKQITPFSKFRKNMKSSMIACYNSIERAKFL